MKQQKGMNTKGAVFQVSETKRGSLFVLRTCVVDFP